MKKQAGSAHVIIVVILVVALLGALGFIFWQNFMKSDDTGNTKTSSESVNGNQSPKDVNLTAYEGEGYDFDYPSDNWRVEEVQYNYDNKGPVAVEVRTKDYKMARDNSIEKGAVISVDIVENEAMTTLEASKQEAIKYDNASEVEDKTVGGAPAVSWFSTYKDEGTYKTLVFKNNLFYQITYRYAGEGSFDYAAAYDIIVESFRFK